MRLIKPRTREIRRDVLSELMDLLRLRYSLAEKIYFHHTKMVASAMLISAVNTMVQNGNLSEDVLYEMDDDTLLGFLSSEGNEIAKHLASHLRERKLYKIVYDLSYSEEGIARPESQKKGEIVSELTTPKLRHKKERMLETMSSSASQIEKEPGSVVIYCPRKEMGLKEIETLVDYGRGISPLKEIDDSRIRDEIRTSITDKHKELWKVLVLVDPDLSEICRTHVNGDCEELFGLPSASEKYRAKFHKHYTERHAEKWQAEHADSPKLLHDEIDLIKSRLPTRDGKPKDRISYEDFCHGIENLRTTPIDAKEKPSKGQQIQP